MKHSTRVAAIDKVETSLRQVRSSRLRGKDRLSPNLKWHEFEFGKRVADEGVLYWRRYFHFRGQMAVFLWTLRCLVSLLLGVVALVALLGWLVCSTLVSDLNSEESQLARLTSAAETIKHPNAKEIRRTVEEFRDGTNRDLAQARTLLLAVMIVGLAAMGLIHLPDATASLRWPGYTLLASGGVALLFAWLAQATLKEVIGRMANPQLLEEAQRAAAILLRGSVAPGLGAMLFGAAMVIAAYALKRWQRLNVKLSHVKAGCRQKRDIR